MTINMLGKMPKITIEKNSDGCRITDVQNDYTFTYFNQALTDVQVYKMDQVTDEMLESHGVGTVHSELYDDMNAVYPLTMEVLKSLCK